MLCTHEGKGNGSDRVCFAPEAILRSLRTPHLEPKWLQCHLSPFTDTRKNRTSKPGLKTLQRRRKDKSELEDDQFALLGPQQVMVLQARVMVLQARRHAIRKLPGHLRRKCSQKTCLRRKCSQTGCMRRKCSQKGCLRRNCSQMPKCKDAVSRKTAAHKLSASIFAADNLSASTFAADGQGAFSTAAPQYGTVTHSDSQKKNP